MDTLLGLDWTALFPALLNLLGAVSVFLGALIAVFTIIPGDQPEKALQAIVDFISKFSKK